MFLGAGCAKSICSDEENRPLIPDTKGMTLEIRDRVIDAGYGDSWESIVGQVKEPGEEIDQINIEDILTQLRGQIQFGGPSSSSETDEEEKLEQLETEITEGIVDLVDVDLPDESSGYLDLATWLGSTDRHEPVEIFTTNYDLLIEEALERRRISYFDGFVGGHRPFFDRHSVTNDGIPSNWVRLWKLHGSMNWSQEEGESNRIWRTDDIQGERAVIHPSHLKYDQSRKMPYLTLIDRLKAFLKRDESVLFIVGYSFGDEHINDVIAQGLREAPSSSVFAFMYGELDGNSEAIQLAESHGHFSLFAEDAGIVGTNRQAWETHDERPDFENEFSGIIVSETGSGDWQEEFKLGNFEKFGNFLRSVTGVEIE